ncbi:MAG: hypothetical protein MPJ50_17295, partial [Pirellulales bacterium]|nr:hypothetical protein [Pirellulales bacterium]
YDRASNRSWRENTVSKALGTPVYLDEYYTYDGLNRLQNFDRGQLNVGKTAISGTPFAEEDWTLDPLGNWSGYVQKTSGTTDLDQSRSVNKVNEISNITETTGPSWATPAYDRAGNMTSVPKPVDLTASYDCTYDAWNRLAKVKDGSYTIGVYEYDALFCRIRKQFDSNAPSEPTSIDVVEHYYYNAAWQLLETRSAELESVEPENLPPEVQHIWSIRYLDALILRDANTDSNGLCDDERLYYCSDAVMSLTAVLNSFGNVMERMVYSTYGNTGFCDSQWQVVSSSATQPLFTYSGYYYDTETFFMSVRLRVYHSALSWLQRDVLIDSNAIASPYEYALSSPTYFIDPFGADGIGIPPEQTQALNDFFKGRRVSLPNSVTDAHIREYLAAAHEKIIFHAERLQDTTGLSADQIKSSLKAIDRQVSRTRMLNKTLAQRRGAVAVCTPISVSVLSAGVLVASTFGYDLYLSEAGEHGFELARNVGLCRYLQIMSQEAIDVTGELADRMVFRMTAPDGLEYTVRVHHDENQCQCYWVVSHTEEQGNWISGSYRATVYDVPLSRKCKATPPRRPNFQCK